MKVLGHWRYALGEEEGSSQGCHQRNNTQLPLLLASCFQDDLFLHAPVMIPSITIKPYPSPNQWGLFSPQGCKLNRPHFFISVLPWLLCYSNEDQTSTLWFKD